jgi:deoxycytidylate deaminase
MELLQTLWRVVIIPEKQLILGLTGSFGSGCSTLMKALIDFFGFKGVSLSKYVKEEWKSRNPQKKSEVIPRNELQTIGNELRERHGTDYLAKKAIGEAKDSIEAGFSLVFDSIRNLGEVQAFREKFPNFFLIAVDCPTTLRWKRVKSDYEKLGLTEYDFQKDDERDKYEEDIVHGQQVQLCVDGADISINNDENYPSGDIAKDKLKLKIESYLGLMTGENKRPPTPMESNMNMAYTQASNSRCIKRCVGAVLVDAKTGTVLASGYNEVPKPAEPCILKYAGRCFRDIYKQNYFRSLEDKGQTCPKCERELKDLVHPFRCECGFDLDKHFIRDKALNRCRALHAEGRAILSIGSRNAEGLTLYTTTFPCFSCAKGIIESKIKTVVYVEPYPDEEAIEVLNEAGIAVIKFEGVKAKAYFRLFGV